MRKLIDETGNRYGKWVVIKRVENSRSHLTRWLCHCDCGTDRAVLGTSLRSGGSQSCGCFLQWKRLTKEMVGRKFGRLIIIERVGSDKQGNATWLCKCECGNQTIAASIDLRRGHKKSCGCLQIASVSLPKGEAAFNQIFGRMLRSAKRRRYEWQLTKEQFRVLTQRPCYYCGVEPNQGNCLSASALNGLYLYNGLDRVDNSRGYIIDNLVTCCGTCNRAKRTMTTEQFKVWICQIYEHFGKY